jgi:hypothetical protein
LARGIERCCRQGEIAEATQVFAEMTDVASEAIRAMTSLRDSLLAG